MTFYLVAFIALKCPGGWFGGFVPANLRPLICEARATVEPYDRLDRALRRIDDLGADARATLTTCRGLRCKETEVVWTPDVSE